MNSRERQETAMEWFERQPADRKLEALFRSEVMSRCELYNRKAYLNYTAAINETARDFRINSSTIWRWKALIEGVSKIDWLPYLCPRKTMPVLNLPSACIIADGVK